MSPTAWWVIAAMCFGVAIGAPEHRELSALALGAGLALGFRSVVDADASDD